MNFLEFSDVWIKKLCSNYERATGVSEKTQTWQFGQVSTTERPLFDSSHLGWFQADKCFSECKEKVTVQEIKRAETGIDTVLKSQSLP